MKGKIFNAQEVQAILNGSKVIFREVIKFSKNKTTREFQEIALKKISEGFSEYNVCLNDFFKCHYQAGQKIFCKESFNIFAGQVSYKQDLVGAERYFWRPAQHMKQEHSRLTLLIKEIKVERLGDISEEDAIAEGFAKITKDGSLYKYGIPDRDGLPGTNDFGWAWADWQKTAKEAFAVFWNATHKKPEDKFESNPWVWAIDFEVWK